MPSSNSILTLTAILVLSLQANTVTAKKKNLRTRNNQGRKLRRGHNNDKNNVPAKRKGQERALEEDVAFFTNMARKMQDMSIPTTPSPTPSLGGTPVPTLIIVDPTQPPADNTPSPVVGGDGSGGGVITNPPVPVAAVICLQGETCTIAGDVCSDGTTEECCGEVFDSFVCDCIDSGADGGLSFNCRNTDACVNLGDCTTDPPASAPTPTMPPIPDTGGFNCPDASFVGCTAVDPANPSDECPTVGEPCPNANAGEFCCLDGCPRNYCTAKQATMSVSGSGANAIFIAPIDDEYLTAMEGLTPNER